MEIKLPLCSGMRAWLESLSADAQAILSPSSNDEPASATIARLTEQTGELGSRALLLIAQSDASHGLEEPEAHDDRVGRSRRNEDPVRNLASPNGSDGERYRQLARARKAASEAFSKGKKTRPRKRRRK